MYTYRRIRKPDRKIKEAVIGATLSTRRKLWSENKVGFSLVNQRSRRRGYFALESSRAIDRSCMFLPLSMAPYNITWCRWWVDERLKGFSIKRSSDVRNSFFFSFLYWIFSVFSLNKQLQIYIYIAISNGYISLKQLYGHRLASFFPDYYFWKYRNY